jgi:hypothetical protein
MKILISAGHNPGTDPGAIGQGEHEADNNVAIANRVTLYLKDWFVGTSHSVIHMPDNVGNLDAEIKWANKNIKFGEGFAIQIHRNAGGGTGNEIWTTNYANQIKFAETVLKTMTEITKLPSRGVRDTVTYKRPLGWISGLNSESILIEARFIDKDDISHTADMIDAYAIACGIADYLKVPRGKSMEQKQIDDANAAALAQAAAKAEADRLAKLAEQARIDAQKALDAKLAAEAAAKKAAEEQAFADKQKAEADKALRDAVNNENLNILEIIFKALKQLITAILAKKG